MTSDPAPAPDGGGRWTVAQRALLAALAVVCALRFLRLDADPPYRIYEATGTYVADESWYLKCSLLLVRFGTWRNEFDLNPFTHNPLQTFVHAAAYAVAGVGILVSRTIVVAASIVSVACVARIARASGRTASLVAALLVATSIQHFGQSRLAAPENLAQMLSLLAIAAWSPDRRAVRACVLGMAAAVAAYLCKVSFAFTALTVGAAWAWVALRAWRAGDRRTALPIAATVAAAAAVVVAMPLFMASYAPDDFRAQTHANVGVQAARLSLGGVFRNEWAMARHVGLDRWRAVATAAAAAGLLAWAVARARRTPRPRLDGRLALLLAWGAAGLLLHGWAPIQPPRYFTFAIVPLAAAATLWAPLAGPRVRGVLLGALLAAHVAWQVPGFAEWTSRTPYDSRLAMARDVAGRLDAEPGEGAPTLVGLHATNVALESRRVRPVDWEFSSGPEEVRRRLLRWTPGFAIGTEPEVEMLLRCAGDRAERGELVATYRVLGTYPRDRPVLLVRLHWR